MVQTLGIVAGLALTCSALQNSTNAVRVANLFQITTSHRDMWNQVVARPELRLVLDHSITREPTPDEHLFVSQLIHHLSATYQAETLGALTTIERMEDDVVAFFTLPIPNKVWQQSRKYQNREFAAFVDAAISSRPSIRASE